MASHIDSLTGSDEGASAVEYGLLVAAIAATVITVVFVLGTVVDRMFTDTCESLVDNGQVSAECDPG